MSKTDKVTKGTRYSKVRRVATEWYKRWMPYPAAVMTVQACGIRSRAHYWKWHDENKPHSIPKFPNRVYTEEWDSWNKYLGNDNTYKGLDSKNKKPWTPYWEAARIVQSHKFSCKREYLAGHDKLSGNIPKCANVAYSSNWKGWPAFLGVDVSSRVEVAKHVVGIVALCTSTLLSSNVLEVVIAPGGKKDLLAKLGTRSDMRVLKAYVWETDVWINAKSILEAMSTEGEPGKYIVPNVNALLYELDALLLMYRE